MCMHMLIHEEYPGKVQCCEDIPNNGNNGNNVPIVGERQDSVDTPVIVQEIRAVDPLWPGLTCVTNKQGTHVQQTTRNL